jgi:hypothetical protein
MQAAVLVALENQGGEPVTNREGQYERGEGQYERGAGAFRFFRRSRVFSLPRARGAADAEGGYFRIWRDETFSQMSTTLGWTPPDGGVEVSRIHSGELMRTL